MLRRRPWDAGASWNDSVSLRAGTHDALLVSFAPRNFLSIVKAKFGLPDR